MSAQPAVGKCQNCGGTNTLITPLHGDRGGPLFCLQCGSEWHAKHSKQRKFGRLLVKVMRQYFEAGGSQRDFNRMTLAAFGVHIDGMEPDTIGVEAGDITTELLDAAVRLTHPDRHPQERQEDAKRVTQELLALKPYTFPAPKNDSVSSRRREAEESSAAPRNESFNGQRGHLKKPSFPCETCSGLMPFYYCDPCKAEWNRRQEAEREKRREKQRDAYRRRQKNRRFIRELKNPPVCVSCGEKFTGKRKDAKYCSAACRQREYQARKEMGK